MSENTVPVAIIGLGVIGAKHVRIASGCDAARLVGCFDPDEGRCGVAEEAGAPFYRDVRAMLDEARPEAAIIAAPTQVHLSLARDCAERGIHMLMEKPIASNLEEARAIVELGRSHGVRIAVGHQRRHNPRVHEAREIIQGGRLGTLLGFTLMEAMRKHDSYFDVPWRTQPGGGPVLINLIHDIDALRAICGEIASVYARTSTVGRGGTVEDTASVSLEMDSGALGSILLSDAAASPWAWEMTSAEYDDFPEHEQNCCHFLGTEASLAYPRMDLWRYVDPANANWGHPLAAERVAGAPARSLEAQMENLCAMARGEAEPVVSAVEGARTLACVEAVHESARRGSAVVPNFEGM